MKVTIYIDDHHSDTLYSGYLKIIPRMGDILHIRCDSYVINRIVWFLDESPENEIYIHVRKE